MGSHKHKKKYESDSSSSDSESSASSSESSKKKVYSKKKKRSSSEESGDEKYSKSKKRRSSDNSDTEVTRKYKNRKQETVEKSSDYKCKVKDRHEKSKDGERQERKEKNIPNRHKSLDRDRGKSRDREPEEFRSRRDHDKERYDDRDRNRRDHNAKDRQDDRYRNKRDDYRRDDRRFLREQGDSKDYRDDNNDYRNRARDKRDNHRYGNRRRSSSFDHANAKWGKQEHSKQEKKEPQEKEKPNFKLTGKLTEETNTYRGVVIKYSEPPEARKPRRRWRLYPFKGEKALQTLYIHRESAYLIGRERKVVDLPVDHPSCSKQHAALQYRLVPFTREDGSSGKRVRPYLIDLESANGTYINNKKIEAKKYVELFEKDVIKFGYSSREYVLLHENSKDEAMDDDVKQEEELPIKEEPQ